jgi:hypothetical protein
VGENLHPGHLVQWTRLAYNRDPAEPFGDFTGLVPWRAQAGPVPPYPVASNQREHQAARTEPASAGRGTGTENPARSVHNGFSPDTSALRDEIRRLILEELAQLAGG